MIRVLKYLPKYVIGITIFPFVIVRDRTMVLNKILINHERIHLRQQLELLIIFFYILYVCEFLIRLLVYRKWNYAYRMISFEKEAYANEKDLNYLKSKSYWSFINFY
ncbi:MAG: hypothetical protein KJN82_06370 [Bacteroidia bacterium]|nr:hypothetical protein [Bacteroidia bacterium]